MSSSFDIEAMRDRLKASLTENGFSMRSISLKAELGPGYVHAVLSGEKVPSVTNLAKICEAANLSLSYVLYGFDLSPETERLISLIEAHPEKRDGIFCSP